MLTVLKAAALWTSAASSSLGPDSDVCPTDTSRVDTFEARGLHWTACEDLQVPGGTIALVPSEGATEWFTKVRHIAGRLQKSQAVSSLILDQCATGI
eukprot:SAG31_NODE_7176_length_1764_cov_1.500600_3_plen_97_part_00